MRIVKTILKIGLCIFAAFSTGLTALAIVGDKAGWIRQTKCECGGKRVTYHGPLKKLG